jgi:hypothetical protein
MSPWWIVVALSAALLLSVVAYERRRRQLNRTRHVPKPTEQQIALQATTQDAVDRGVDVVNLDKVAAPLLVRREALKPKPPKLPVEPINIFGDEEGDPRHRAQRHPMTPAQADGYIYKGKTRYDNLTQRIRDDARAEALKLLSPERRAELVAEGGEERVEQFLTEVVNMVMERSAQASARLSRDLADGSYAKEANDRFRRGLWATGGPVGGYGSPQRPETPSEAPEPENGPPSGPGEAIL